MTAKILAIATLSLCTLAVAASSEAQHRRGSAGASGSAGSSGPATAGPAGPRGGGGPVVVSPRVVVRPGYRSYYYPRFYSSYYSPYYYPYGYYGSYSFGGGYAPYGYGGGYVVAGGATQAYGSIRITDAPKDAQVFADGYYVGEVDDFDGAFQHLNLEAGTHHIEIREPGQTATSVDVNIRPGESITYHAK